MPERIRRDEIQDAISDDQVETLWALPLERLLAKGLDEAAVLAALTDGQRAVRLLVSAQGAINNGGVSHLYERDDIATPELVKAAKRIGAAGHARFFSTVIRGRRLIERSPTLEARLTNRFYELSSDVGEHLYALTPLILAYADQHPDEFFEP